MIELTEIKWYHKMPTLDQIKEFYASIGVPAPPDFVILAWMDIVSAIQPCLDGAGYSEAVQLMIYLYTLSLYGIVSGDKYISSQTAPSGASQSFRYNNLQDKYRGMLNSLRMLDTSGCTDSVIPAEPGASAGLWVSTGGKCC